MMEAFPTASASRIKLERKFQVQHYLYQKLMACEQSRKAMLESGSPEVMDSEGVAMDAEMRIA